LKYKIQMNNTYRLEITYPKIISLNQITSLVKSVQGVHVQGINLVSTGRDVVGILTLETPDQINVSSVVTLMRSWNEITVDVKDF